MIRGSPNHIDLTVADLDRSIAFYDRVLGRLGYTRGPRSDPSEAPEWLVVDAETSVFSIALHRATSAGLEKGHDRYTPGLHHLAFHADSRRDVDEFYDFLREIGATILDPPAEYAYTRGYYAVFFADPDGMKLEVVFEPTRRGRPA
jgi:catechol 2,3-dioxygenase-like lactoylglutathione lyase family enzyme